MKAPSAGSKQNVSTLEFTTTDYHALLAARRCASHLLRRPSSFAYPVLYGHHPGRKTFARRKTVRNRFGRQPRDPASDRREPGVFVRCSSELPFFPGGMAIIRSLLEKDFGKIIEVESGLLHSSDLNPKKAINWKRMIEYNGEYGCMGDLGMHALHIPLQIRLVPGASSCATQQNRPGTSGWQRGSCSVQDLGQCDHLWRGRAKGSPISDHHSDQTDRSGRREQLVHPGDRHQAFHDLSTKYPKTLQVMELRGGRTTGVATYRSWLRKRVSDDHRFDFRVRVHRQHPPDVGSLLRRTDQRPGKDEAAFLLRDAGGDSSEPFNLHPGVGVLRIAHSSH